MSISEGLRRKLSGLAALANHVASDPQESAAAAAKIQALITRYGLDPQTVEAELSGNATTAVRTPESVETRIVYVPKGQKLSSWVNILGVAVAGVNGCVGFQSRRDNRTVLVFVGTPLRLSGAEYVLQWLINEIQQLTKAAGTTRGLRGRTALNQYRIGAVEAISKKLKEAAAAERTSMWEKAASVREADAGSALIRLDRLAEVEEAENTAIAAETRKLRLRATNVRFNRDDTARAAGRHDGRTVGLGGGKGALGTGNGQIKG